LPKSSEWSSRLDSQESRLRSGCCLPYSLVSRPCPFIGSTVLSRLCQYSRTACIGFSFSSLAERSRSALSLSSRNVGLMSQHTRFEIGYLVQGMADLGFNRPIRAYGIGDRSQIFLLKWKPVWTLAPNQNDRISNE